MSGRKAKLQRKIAEQFGWNLSAIKRDYQELSHQHKGEITVTFLNLLKEANVRNS